MTDPYWPLFALRLASPDLVLRPVTEADLAELAGLLPDDVEQDLALAFGPLQAQAAITSAWHDNHASLGVSRALGYRPNGESLHARGHQTGCPARDGM
jgi:hypothetical protein